MTRGQMQGTTEVNIMAKLGMKIPKKLHGGKHPTITEPKTQLENIEVLGKSRMKMA